MDHRQAGGKVHWVGGGGTCRFSLALVQASSSLLAHSDTVLNVWDTDSDREGRDLVTDREGGRREGETTRWNTKAGGERGESERYRER